MLLGGAARRMGYMLRPLAPLDLRAKTRDPVEAMYLAGARNFVIEVPVEHCRGWLGFPLGGLHPYVRTARACLDDPLITYEQSPLKQYYDHFQPKNAAEALGLIRSGGSYFQSASPSQTVFPWTSTNPQIAAEKKRKVAEHETRNRGEQLDSAHGIATYGPVSVKRGAQALANLKRLTANIAGAGYRRDDTSDGDIRAVAAFAAADEVRYFIGSGHHRAAILAALGHKTIPVRIDRKIAPRLADAAKWPHVRDGLYAVDQAVEMFERMFAGRPPKGAVPPTWLEGAELEARWQPVSAVR
jgi:hypothetical protein